MHKLMGTVAGLLAVMVLALNVGAQGAVQGKGKAGGGPIVQGKVSMIDAEKKSFAVEGKAGKKNVITNDKTEFYRETEGKMADVKEGTVVRVLGRVADDAASIEAYALVIQAAGAQPGKAPGKGGGNNMTGTVATIGENMTIKTRDDKSISVKTTPQTRVAMAVKAAFTDLKDGVTAAVVGPAEGDNVTATRVTIQLNLGKGKGKA